MSYRESSCLWQRQCVITKAAKFNKWCWVITVDSFFYFCCVGTSSPNSASKFRNETHTIRYGAIWSTIHGTSISFFRIHEREYGNIEEWELSIHKPVRRFLILWNWPGKVNRTKQRSSLNLGDFNAKKVPWIQTEGLIYKQICRLYFLS